VRERLLEPTHSLADRLRTHGVTSEEVDRLVDPNPLPAPLTLAGLPKWPPSLGVSLGDRFVGRSDEFYQLHDALWNRREGAEAAAGLSCALHGGGGFGKTQLALEYLHRMGRDRAGLLLATTQQELDDLLVILSERAP
jgi:hypothetical protein